MVLSIQSYQNTVIYKIICKDEKITNTYVGLTINFDKRRKSHINNYKAFKKNKLYDFIRENGGLNNWLITAVERCCCYNRKEAGLREKYWYETLNADLNKNYPSRNGDEWYQANKERLLELNRIWREKNIHKPKNITIQNLK